MRRLGLDREQKREFEATATRAYIGICAFQSSWPTKTTLYLRQISLLYSVFPINIFH